MVRRLRQTPRNPPIRQASRAEQDVPKARGIGSGRGGIGFTLASGYIEISAGGTRYVAVASNRDRIIGAGVGLMIGLVAVRLLRR
ncbi:MAG TPA: hypothetical protein VK821_08520 [Dehalococcoidia bacterium]|nr:hypothetical protein [Dehalococcoidia bacterium]